MTHNGTSYLAQSSNMKRRFEELEMEVKKNQEEIEIGFNALEQPHLAIRENKVSSTLRKSRSQF